jgi:predicted dehydrogenase
VTGPQTTLDPAQMNECTPMSNRPCRWAILGTAGIARKNWLAIRQAENARLVAVASRDRARARAFIDECEVSAPGHPPPDAVGSYDEVLDRDDVDAVYVPLPTGIRAEWVIRAAERRKHVLVEKPCAVDLAELKRIVVACRAHDVQFMDGVMWLHSRRAEAVRLSLRAADADGGIGTIRRIATQFTFRAPEAFFTDNIRAQGHLEPLGCLGDLGWYTIGFILWALHPHLPDAVDGRLLATHAAGQGPAVPTEFSGELSFRGDGHGPGISASFFCSFLIEHQQWVHVSGSRGSLRIDDFVLPFFGCETSFTLSYPRFVQDGCDFRMERHDHDIHVEEYANGHATAQETNLFREFSALVLSGRRDDRWPEMSLAVQRVMMDCLAAARAR